MLASIRSRWGPYAAPRIFGGHLSGRLPLTLVDLTWARYPQKSQMISAHLKFAGSFRSVLSGLLQPGRRTHDATNSSPRVLNSCLTVGFATYTGSHIELLTGHRRTDTGTNGSVSGAQRSELDPADRGRSGRR